MRSDGSEGRHRPGVRRPGHQALRAVLRRPADTSAARYAGGVAGARIAGQRMHGPSTGHRHGRANN